MITKKQEELLEELSDLKFERIKGISLFIIWIILDIGIKVLGILENKEFDIYFFFLILSTTTITLLIGYFVRKDSLRIKEIKKELFNFPEQE